MARRSCTVTSSDRTLRSRWSENAMVVPAKSMLCELRLTPSSAVATSICKRTETTLSHAVTASAAA